MPGAKEYDFTGVGIVLYDYAHPFLLKNIRGGVIMIVNIKAMKACIRIMRSINPYITADDFQENNCSITIKRFYKAMASKFIRKGAVNKGNQKKC